MCALEISITYLLTAEIALLWTLTAGPFESDFRQFPESKSLLVTRRSQDTKKNVAVLDSMHSGGRQVLEDLILCPQFKIIQHPIHNLRCYFFLP